MTETLGERYHNVKSRIVALDPAVELVVVTKGQTIEDIQTLYDCGERQFGESYLDEWEGKVANLPKDIEWHFIGPMQSRKAKKFKSLLGSASLVQSLDRKSILSILSTLDSQVPVLAQVNLWGESQKGGVSAEDLGAFLEEIETTKNVDCFGLMAIPPFTNVLEETEAHFSEVRDLYLSFAERYKFNSLSIGMSSDFESAIEAGATMVRVGSAIFGGRI